MSISAKPHGQLSEVIVMLDGRSAHRDYMHAEPGSFATSMELRLVEATAEKLRDDLTKALVEIRKRHKAG